MLLLRPDLFRVVSVRFFFWRCYINERCGLLINYCDNTRHNLFLALYSGVWKNVYIIIIKETREVYIELYTMFLVVLVLRGHRWMKRSVTGTYSREHSPCFTFRVALMFRDKFFVSHAKMYRKY